MVSLTEAERSFYEQILAKARPARTALLQEDAADKAPASFAGPPGSSSGMRWRTCTMHTKNTNERHTPWDM